ncbi:MAG: FtsX-like permease family protein [Candidatus Saccharibacteria bacterium]
MHIIDSFTLARTKRSVRPLRTFLTVFVCALLFALLIAASFLIGGIQNNASGLKKIGYNSHYLAVATSNALNNNYGDVENQARVELDNDLRARQITVNDTLRNSDQYQMSLLPYAAALGLKQEDTTYSTYEAQVRHRYNPTAIYHFNQVSAMSNARMIVGGVDPLLYEQQQEIIHNVPARSVKAADEGTPSMTTVETKMLQTLVQPGQSLAWKQGDPMPILVPYAYIVQASHTDVSSLSAAQKDATYKKLIARYSGTDVTYCYRNQSAQSQLSTALQFNKTLTAKNAAQAISTGSCAPLDQHLLAKDNLLETDSPGSSALYAKAPAPITQTISFKIVGFVPTNYESFDANGIPKKGSFIEQFFGAVNDWGTLTNPAIMPLEVADQVPLFQQDTSSGFLGGATDRQLFVDFASAADQKRFVDSGCQGMTCMQGAVWSIRTFGNTLVASESIVTVGARIILWAGAVLGGIAMVLIMITVGKIISDSRREIAVFKALGAQPRDIFQLYWAYGVLLAASIGVTALLLATALTAYIALHFTPSLHAALVAASGAYGATGPRASLFGFRAPLLAVLFLAIVLATLIGISISVATNSRRNLVQFMKEE